MTPDLLGDSFSSSQHGIANFYIQGHGGEAMNNAVINAVSVYQLNVFCISGCRSLSIYPPIHSGDNVFNYVQKESFLNNRRRIPEASIQGQANLSDPKPEIQIYEPLGLLNTNITCTDGCGTVVFVE